MTTAHLEMASKANEFGPESATRQKVSNVNVDKILNWLFRDYFQISCKLVITVEIQGIQIIKPIVYGNIARYFGKKREADGHTHQWTVYLKPYLNEVLCDELQFEFLL